MRARSCSTRIRFCSCAARSSRCCATRSRRVASLSDRIEACDGSPPVAALRPARARLERASSCRSISLLTASSVAERCARMLLIEVTPVDTASSSDFASRIAASVSPCAESGCASTFPRFASKRFSSAASKPSSFCKFGLNREPFADFRQTPRCVDGPFTNGIVGGRGGRRRLSRVCGPRRCCAATGSRGTASGTQLRAAARRRQLNDVSPGSRARRR